MLVTGVQAVGAKGVTAIQGTVVDIKEATRAGVDGDPDGDRAAGRRAIDPTAETPTTTTQPGRRRAPGYNDAGFAQRARTSGSKCSSGNVS
jgi:hypothetical protein